MSKAILFLWQLCHNALPVKGVLLKRGFNVDPTCPLCLDDIESSTHLFKDCMVTQKVWEYTTTHNWLPNSMLTPTY